MVESIKELGMINASYKHIVEILNVRFKHVPESLIEKIEDSDDLSFLSKLHKEAILTESIEAFDRFRKAMAKMYS